MAKVNYYQPVNKNIKQRSENICIFKPALNDSNLALNTIKIIGPMKNSKIFLVLVLCFLSVKLFSQAYQQPESREIDAVYIPAGFIGISTGINNINGLLGINAEALIFRNFTLGGAAGLGLWGYKFSAAGRYYLNYPKGVYFGLAYSTCTGQEEIYLGLETTDDPGGTSQVLMNLTRAQTLNIMSGIQWRFGKRFRMGLEYGYALPLQEQAWEVVSEEVELTDTSEQTLNFLTPGGIIIGFGISFGIR